MPRPQLTDLDMGGLARVTGLPAPLAASDAVPRAWLDARVGAAGAPAFVPASGSYVLPQTSGQGTAATGAAGAAGRMELFPWQPSHGFEVNGLGVNVTTGVSGAQAKVAIYASDAQGRPDALLLESGVLDCASTGAKVVAASLVITAGLLLWVGVRHSSTASLTIMTATSLQELPATSIGNALRKCLRRTVAFGTAAPATWGFDSAEVADGATPAALWLRAA